MLERFRDGRIAVADFVELKHFLESDGDVPQGELTDLFATSRDEMYASRNKQQWPGSLA